MTRCATPKPTKGSKTREKARAKARQRRSDWFVYQAVDLRDEYRCRLCQQWKGEDIQRHHIVFRSQCGETTTANVLSLCAECHEAVHAHRVTLSGDADTALTVVRAQGISRSDSRRAFEDAIKGEAPV